ncbi:restriction endonuclease [Candidatus Saccharibacteria bacterium]|nr:restriction endonuclease [Candidatus Saccharibacteria bacterium]
MLLDFSESAIKATEDGQVTYCKFITPNDTGSTGGHQSGYHISKTAWSLFFDLPGHKGENKDKTVTILWQDDFETESRFTYYGTGTRNEYRLTRFGRGFHFLNDENIGSLLVISRVADDYYKAYVLETEIEIENYLNFFGISPDRANGLISELTATPIDLQGLIDNYIQLLSTGFPATETLSAKAREIFFNANRQNELFAERSPDLAITSWIDTEFDLFKAVERHMYKPQLTQPFSDIEGLVSFSNTILNRRKSRAGKSLEHHLEKVFDVNRLPYTSQGITEGRKKPDFIIPSIELYHDKNHSADKLIFLGAKTTCKDRWRQVLNEANRIPHKHLFTLQQGISSNQLQEMKDENLTLVVPEKHLPTFSAEHRSDILTLKKFIVKSKEIIS